MNKLFLSPMLSVVGSFLTNRRHWPIFAFWLVAMVYDAVTRLDNPHLSQSAGRVDQDELIVEPQAKLSADLYATLIERLNLQRATPADARSGDFGSLAESKGDESYIWRSPMNAYRLVAVFKQRDRFAVVERLGHGGDRSELIDVLLGDDLDGYEVFFITEHSISVRHGDGSIIRLRLFDASNGVE